MYIGPNHAFCMLNDDIFGMRAEENQVRTFSYRKAYRKWHSMTAVADAMFWVLLHAGLGRRGESEEAAISKLLE